MVSFAKGCGFESRSRLYHYRKNMNQTIEQKVASAILEKNIGEIEIDGTTYKIGAPSIATLILASEIISTLPTIDKANIAPKDITYSVLQHARYFKPLGELAAVLILGAKGLNEEVVEETEKRCLFGLIRRKKRIARTIDRKAELAEKILTHVSPSVLLKTIIARLNQLEVGDFFLITTSLSEANLLKPTKEVVD